MLPVPLHRPRKALAQGCSGSPPDPIARLRNVGNSHRFHRPVGQRSDRHDYSLPRKLAYALNGSVSLFLLATYTIWSREFPWWFADAAAPNPLRPLIALLAIPLWLLYGFAAIRAITARTATMIEA